MHVEFALVDLCGAEPSSKATFDFTISAGTKYEILCNMNEVESSVNGDVKTLKFARTPKMSTYLAALVVGALDSVEGERGGERRARGGDGILLGLRSDIARCESEGVDEAGDQ